MFSDQALTRFLEYQWDTCLDIGSGNGGHSRVMNDHGRKTVMIDSGHQADITEDYMRVDVALPYRAIWCSHVLEHQVNPGAFLEKMFNDLQDGGVLAVTVPPAKHEIVGGHVTLWNAGLLLYQMILAGFDCCDARVGIYGYNISVIVEKSRALLPDLRHDAGDIETLSHLFPIPVKQGFDGQVGNIDW